MVDSLVSQTDSDIIVNDHYEETISSISIAPLHYR